MARAQAQSRRKSTGGRYHSSRGKRSRELAGFAAQTKIGAARKAKIKRARGGSTRSLLLVANEVNVTDKSGKTQKVPVLNVVENPADPNLVGRNILTKGAVVETKLGKARITSRPGQEATVNAVLV